MRQKLRIRKTYLPTGYQLMSNVDGEEYTPQGRDFVTHIKSGPGKKMLGRRIKDYQTAQTGTKLLEFTIGNLNSSYTAGGWETNYYVEGTQNPPPPGYSPDVELLDFATWFNAQLYDEMSSGPNALVFLGELHEVLALISNPFNELVRVKEEIDALLHGGAPSTRVSKALADLHLQYNFAVKPLISDVEKAIKLANKILKRRTYTFVRRERDTVQTFSHSTSLVYNVGNSGTNWNFSDIMTITGHTRGSALYWSETSGNSLPTLSDLGLSYSNLAVGIEELIPWSFLADYLINLSSVIKSHSVRTFEVPYGTLMNVQLSDHSLGAALVSPVGAVGSCHSSKSLYKQHKRISLKDVVLPVTPSLSQAINTGQLRNMAALFVKKFT